MATAPSSRPSSARTEAEPRLQVALRTVGVILLLGAGPLAYLHPIGIRLVWSLLVMALPLGIVLAGYHPWRRVCPLAFFGTLGQRLNRQGKRKVGEWLSQHQLEVQFGFLALALAFRHLGANDAPWALAALFGGVILSALLVGFRYTGKTWCNHFCPVGLVEKLYLEPTQLRSADRNSQCPTCTACKKNCPDIDLEQAYWKEADLPARRRVYYLWPGLVLGYFLYPWLATGGWTAYGAGAWLPAGSAPNPGSGGFWFLPAIPRILAVPLVLIGFSALGGAAFRILEAWLGRRGLQAREARHRAQALASFSGFLIFYGFAGRALVSLLPAGIADLLGLGVAVAATLVLLGRWQRREEDYVHEKAARGLLKRWEWGETPATDRLSDLYLLHQERVQQRDARLGAYKATLRDLLSEGVLNAGNLRMLQRLRQELGISDKDHDKLVADLHLEDARLLDPEYQGSMEKQLQLDQYRQALEVLLLESDQLPEPAVLDRLRQVHGVEPEDHASVLASLRGETGPLRARLQAPVRTLLALHQAALATETLAEGWSRARSLEPARARRLAFLRHLLAHRQRQLVRQILRLLELLPGGADLLPLHRLLERPNSDSLQESLHQLGALADQGPVASELAPLADLPKRVEDPWPALVALVSDASPHLRATLLTLLVEHAQPDAEARIRTALLDEDPLVRDTAQALLDAPPALTAWADSLEPEDEQTWLLRVAAQALPEAPQLNRAGRATLRQPRTQLATSSQPSHLAAIEKLMFLHGIPLFSDLDPEDLELVARAARERHWNPDESLCLEGEWSDEVFLLLRGWVRAWIRDAAGGDASVLGDSGPGTCLGEMAALDIAPRAASLTALTPVDALAVDGPTFRTVLRARPEVGEGVLRVLSRRLRALLRDLPASRRNALEHADSETEF